MKKTLILLLFPVLSFGQGYDSLKQRILKLEVEQNELKLNLEKYRDHYYLGTSLMIAGAAISAVAALIQKDNPDQRNKYTFSIIGASTFVAGTVIQIDSHKWVRTGRRKRQ